MAPIQVKKICCSEYRLRSPSNPHHRLFRGRPRSPSKSPGHRGRRNAARAALAAKHVPRCCASYASSITGRIKGRAVACAFRLIAPRSAPCYLLSLPLQQVTNVSQSVLVTSVAPPALLSRSSAPTSRSPLSTLTRPVSTPGTRTTSPSTSPVSTMSSRLPAARTSSSRPTSTRESLRPSEYSDGGARGIIQSTREARWDARRARTCQTSKSSSCSVRQS